MPDSAWVQVLDEMYQDKMSISKPLDEENPDIKQLANSAGVNSDEVVDSISDMHHANLVIRTNDGYCLSDSGFAEGRARLESKSQAKRQGVMFLVTAVLAVSSIVQSLRFLDQYPPSSQIAVGFVYLLLTASIGAYLNYYQVLIPTD